MPSAAGAKGDKMTLLKSRVVSVALAALILALCLLIAYLVVFQDLSKVFAATSSKDLHGVKPRMEGSLAFNASNRRKLVGASDHVFVGRVLKKVSSKGTQALKPIPGVDSTTPDTQFEVEVVNNIKGNLHGKVTVSQHGGRDKNGQLVLLEKDPLFEPGKVYVICTNNEPQRGWQQEVAGPFGKSKAKNARQMTTLVDKFKAAKRNEIPLKISNPNGATQ